MDGVLHSATRSPFVGRDDDLAHLRDVFARVRGGEPSAVLIGGEAGIGKTRLVEEFAAEARRDGALVVSGHSVALDGAELAFAPILGVVRGLVAEFGPQRVVELAGPSGDALATLMPELGASPGEAGDGRLYEVVTSLLERVATEQPLVVIVEDLQWADGPTRDVLRFLVRGLVDASVLLVMTYRDDAVGRGHPLRQFVAEMDRTRSVVRLTVDRLGRTDVAEQLRGLVGHDIDAAHIDRVFSRSEGVPFYVEELAASVDDAGRGRLPASLRDVLLARVEPLAEVTLRLLRQMAIAGRHVEHGLVEAVAEVDVASLDGALREAVSAGVIVVDGDGYGFRHSLLREALHDDMLPGEHARMHGRYARILEEQPSLVSGGRVAAEIAHHWYFAHDVDRAFRWSLRAAEELADADAHASAQVMLERALELWDRIDDPEAISGGDRIALMVRASYEAMDAGEADRSIALSKAALDELDEQEAPDRVAEVLGWLGRVTCKAGLPGGADMLIRARELIGPEDSVARARVLEWLSNILMLEWRFDEALPMVDEAERVALAVGAAHLAASARITRACIWAERGRRDEALAEFTRLRPAEIGDADIALRYYINHSHALGQVGRYTEAFEVAVEGKKHASATGRGRTHGSMLAGNAAYPLVYRGEWARAERLIERAVDLVPPAPHLRHLYTLRAWLALWRGDTATAERLVGELRGSLAGRVIYPQDSRHVARVEGELFLALGDDARAWSTVVGELASVEAADAPGFDLPLAFIGARALAARRCAGGGSDRADDPDVSWLRATVARLAGSWSASPWPLLVEAELTDRPELWQQARAELAAAEGPAHLRPYIGYRMAMALLDEGHPEEAATALHDAAEEADELGAGLISAWIDELRTRLTFGASPEQPRFGLTARELEVLRLIAAGCSNREIGERLVIAGKTASVHVSNILAKLGVSSRVEAAAVAYREGLAGADGPAVLERP